MRSYRGGAGGWFRRAVANRQGRIRVGALDRDVSFEDADSGGHDASTRKAIDQAYRTKYARHGAGYVTAMTAPAAATLRLVPR